MIDDLLGIPYRPFGRDKRGFYCYGLVEEIYRRLGRKLPDALNGDTFIRNFRKTDSPEMWDILLFRDGRGNVCHIGVYLKNDDFIHCDVLGVHIEKLSRYFRKYEVYQWQ